jgi:uncharacterized cupin superfamily protein
VHEHEDIPGADKEPVVVTRKELFRGGGGDASVVGSASSRGVSTYDVGATRAGSWMCSPGSFDVSPRPVAEVFVVVKGAMFLTNNDGSARRCGVGDVVHLPEMWSGRVDVVEEVATVFAEVAETGSRVAGEVDAKYAGSDTRGASRGNGRCDGRKRGGDRKRRARRRDAPRGGRPKTNLRGGRARARALVGLGPRLRPLPRRATRPSTRCASRCWRTRTTRSSSPRPRRDFSSTWSEEEEEEDACSKSVV